MKTLRLTFTVDLDLETDIHQISELDGKKGTGIVIRDNSYGPMVFINIKDMVALGLLQAALDGIRKELMR